VLAELSELSDALRVLSGRLDRLPRMVGYDDRFAARSTRHAGDRSWVTRPLIDSCHTVWMELHEDLLATLGLRSDAGS